MSEVLGSAHGLKQGGSVLFWERSMPVRKPVVFDSLNQWMRWKRYQRASCDWPQFWHGFRD